MTLIFYCNNDIEKSNENNTKSSIKFYCLIITCMSSTEKKQIKKNLIKFVIWIVLLGMSWSYIQKHPAEKVSVFSWFEVMFQKVEIFIQNTFGQDGELLERKYSMQKYYKELIKMAENNKCLDIGTISELETLYHNLRKEDKDMLESVLPEYTKKAYEFDSIVKDDSC